jgi:hypothetical protein
MDAPAAILVIRWLVRDTFRQARASGIFWLMLAVSALSVALCLSIRVEGDEANDEALPRVYFARANAAVATLVADGAAQSLGVWRVPATIASLEYNQVMTAIRQKHPIIQGRLTLAFGAIEMDVQRDRRHAVRSIQSVLVGWVADAAGLLLALLWTAGFLPTFVEPTAVVVLLAKPVPRWSLLAGKFIGVLVFVAFQAFVFVAGTWLALAVVTGVWDPTYFLCIPLLLLHFGTFFSFSALLAVVTRSTVVSAFGSILFWLMCYGMNYGRHAALGLADLKNVPKSFGFGIEAGYWILPKPLDFHLILLKTLNADDFVLRVVDTGVLAERGAWFPEFSLLSSVLFGLVMLGAAAYEFVHTDY